MDINTIEKCTALSLAGELTFSEALQRLAVAGNERYIVDLIDFKKISYGSEDETYTTSFNFTGPKVARKFDDKAVKDAILDIQQSKIDYQTFLRRIMTAGCCYYEVFIMGKKAIYFGRDGSFHIELFPSADQ